MEEKSELLDAVVRLTVDGAAEGKTKREAEETAQREAAAKAAEAKAKREAEEKAAKEKKVRGRTATVVRVRSEFRWLKRRIVDFCTVAVH